jgi:hypothetical protein
VLGAVGMLQVILQGEEPVDYYFKVLRALCLQGVLFLDPRSCILFQVFCPRSWRSRPRSGRHLLVLVTGCKAKCLRVFWREGLYGRGGGGEIKGVFRIYFLNDGQDREVSKT